MQHSPIAPSQILFRHGARVRAASWLALGWLLVATLTPMGVARAAEQSTLETFEKEATRPAAKAPETSQATRREVEAAHAQSADTDTQSDGETLDAQLRGSVLELIGLVMAAGGSHSYERVSLALDQGGDRIAENEFAAQVPREGGEGVIPFVRIDGSYQRIDSRIHATDTRAEVGYGPFGIDYRKTIYDERDPAATLEVRQYHALYRMSFGDHVEVDIGYGQFELNGRASHSGGSWTTPVLIHPSRNFGFEYRPSWNNINGNDISDHEIAVSVGARYWAVRGGYRWLKSPGSTLEGPFIGASGRI